jgi:alpha-beta hydrolase superfamily lysophospholipase
MPVIIYMHGNAGNKLEGEGYVPLLIQNGICLVTFDFSGCGNSEGQWVTLGWKEQHDLASVIQNVRGTGRFSKIGLWGRSMGGATAIFYMASHEGEISVAIIDSCFSAFSSVVDHITEEQMKIPKAFV